MTTFFKYFIPWLVKKVSSKLASIFNFFVGNRGIFNVRKYHNILTDGLLECPGQTTVFYIMLATMGFLLIMLGLTATDYKYLITLPTGDRIAIVDLYLPYIKVVATYYVFAVICAAYKAFKREQGHMIAILKGKE
jgi:hypothetical protein